MAIIPSDEKVFMSTSSTNTTFGGSAATKAMQQWYTMGDITESVTSVTLSGSGTPNYITKWVQDAGVISTTLSNSVMYEDNAGIVIGPDALQDSNAVLTLTGNINIKSNSPTSDGSMFIGIGSGRNTNGGTGGQNTAIGLGTMKNLTDGSSNTALGYKALEFVTTGKNNVAIGCFAATANETGWQNIAIGGSAYGDAVAGVNNIALGHNSLRRCQTSNNVAIGQNALTDLKTGGGNNTAIGISAFQGGLAHLYATAVGYQAGYPTTGTVGSYTTSVYLGAFSRPLPNVDSTNEIVLGAETYGNGTNTATYGNTLIENHYFPGGNIITSGSVKVADDAAAASATNVGAIRYRSNANNSYQEMSMQTGATTYAWVITQQNTW
jgi:hypothetical protein